MAISFGPIQGKTTKKEYQKQTPQLNAEELPVLENLLKLGLSKAVLTRLYDVSPFKLNKFIQDNFSEVPVPLSVKRIRELCIEAELPFTPSSKCLDSLEDYEE